MTESRIEDIFTHKVGFAVPATSVQRAWCRVISGVPLGDLWDDEDVRNCLGGAQPKPGGRPREIVGCSGIRSGKSQIAASAIVEAALTTELDPKFSRELPPAIPIVSVAKKNAAATFGHVLALMNQPKFKRFLVGEPVKESLVIRNCTGVPVTVRIVANNRAASALASYWYVLAVIDEAFFIPPEEASPINLNDVRKVLLERVLPGGQLLYFGSPLAPVGPAYDLLQRHFGAPSSDCVVLHSNGPAMNPAQWPPEKCASYRDSADADKQDIYTTSVLGLFLRSAGGLLGDDDIRAVTRESAAPIPRQEGCRYVACCDPAHRRNAWTLVVAHLDASGTLVVDFAQQWVPQKGEPLDSEAVLRDIAKALRVYGLSAFTSDQWESNSLKSLARTMGLELVECRLVGLEQQVAYKALVDAVKLRRVELPPGDAMRRDLLNVKRRVTQQGSAYYLARSSDGRHADFAASLALALHAKPVALSLDAERAFPAGFMRGEELPRVRRIEESFGILRPAEHPALDAIFGRGRR